MHLVGQELLLDGGRHAHGKARLGRCHQLLEAAPVRLCQKLCEPLALYTRLEEAILLHAGPAHMQLAVQIQDHVTKSLCNNAEALDLRRGLLDGAVLLQDHFLRLLDHMFDDPLVAMGCFPAQSTVVGHRTKAQHRAKDQVAVRKHAAQHEGVHDVRHHCTHEGDPKDAGADRHVHCHHCQHGVDGEQHKNVGASGIVGPEGNWILPSEQWQVPEVAQRHGRCKHRDDQCKESLPVPA
mmetsp:Transcript_30199/g.71998  ORF Transcript_30199/g.71998 Transcript_30199/m.71998 type:complete len:238 (-) Transcript_30199:187-900(-)